MTREDAIDRVLPARVPTLSTSHRRETAERVVNEYVELGLLTLDEEPKPKVHKVAVAFFANPDSGNPVAFVYDDLTQARTICRRVADVKPHTRLLAIKEIEFTEGEGI